MGRAWWILWALWVIPALTSCSTPRESEETDAGTQPASWRGMCVDADKDGFGFQCKKGDDCDDTDPKLHTDCGCNVVATGCECEDGAEPRECTVSKKVKEETGSLLCTTGMRYCRDGQWTECIGIRSFELPPQAAKTRNLRSIQRGLIDQDAAPLVCDVCAPSCYQANDLLETLPSDPELSPATQGGLTLTPSTGSSGPPDPDEIDPAPGCTPGVIIPQFGQYDNDCDGIPDNFDSVVGLPGTTPPFDTSHQAITMDVAPGETASSTFDLQFALKTVDVYFLLDTTASMDGELNQLIKDLTAGTFLDDPSTPGNEANSITCASPVGSTTSDATLKNKGIAGNIACLVPNSGFGAGYFREIPFDNPDSSRLAHGFDWFIPYEHRQDIDENVTKTLSALKLFYTAGNVSWPENDMFALYAVATGSQIYTGWDRPGVEARDCGSASEKFGWPCFRKSAIPVVVLITDASMMNGPDVDVYNNASLSSCITSAAPYTVTTKTCTTDATCEAAYPGQGYFCYYKLGTGGALSGNCAVQKAISAACKADGLPDGKNDDDSRQGVNYLASQTNTMSRTPDGLYHAVEGNEDFASAHNVGTIDNKFITFAGDTRGMSSDIYTSNLGTTCSQWPTSGSAAATSSTTPGYPDAVFKFTVTDPNKTLTISTAGSHHAPTLAIISTGGSGSTSTTTTQLTAPASSDTTPWSFAAAELSGSFDYSVAADLSSGFTGSWRRSSFGACMEGSTGATDLGPDAVFSFTPDTDMNDVSFSVGGQQVVATSDSAANVSPWKDLGAQLGQTTTYYGTTSTSTTNKWTAAQLGAASCRATGTLSGREHLFKFTLSAAAGLELRLATPSSYDAVLSLFGPTSTTPASGSTMPAPLACQRTAGGDDVITGSYAAGTYYVMVHAYNTTSTTGTYTLTLRELTNEAIVLYDDAPTTPTEFDIAGPEGANTNDQFYDYDVGQIDGQFLILNAGDTSASGIHADYLPESFKDAASSCSNVSGMSNDSVVEFTVDTNRTVRIETFDGTGTDPNQAAGFDHVLAVVERPTQRTTTPTAVTNNDNTATAKVITAATVPTAVGGYSQYTGATYGNANTITMSQSVSPLVMYDVANLDTATCSTVSDDLQDVVYRFDVDASNEGTYDFDTVGSQSTTYLSLHSGSPDSFATITPSVTTRSTPTTDDTTASSSPIGTQTGVALGSVDGKTVSYADTTDASTSNKWTDAQFAGCRLSPSGNQAHEHVLSFTLSATRTMSITMTQTAPYDASIALFSTAPVAGATQTGLKACSRVAGGVASNPGGLTTASNGVLTGSLTAGTYYLVVHGYQGTNNTGSYQISIADMTTRNTRSVANNDSGADGSSTISGVDLGDVRTSVVTYNGTTTSSTHSKWSAAQAGTANGASNGCRVNSSEDTTNEHVLRFTLSGTSNRNLSLALTRGAPSFDPIMSVYTSSGGALAVNSNLSTRLLGCQRAYTANTPSASKVFTGSPALTGVGSAAAGGTLSGTFPPGTYYVVINGASSTAATGSYTLVIRDNTDDSVTPVLVSGENFSNSSLDSAGTGGSSGTSGDTPYADLGTLTGAGFQYTGAISTSTADKWTGPQLGNGSNCQSSGSSTRKRGEHVFKLTVPASTTANVALSSSFSSSSQGVIAYFDNITGIPQVNTSLGSPTDCEDSGGSLNYVTLSNSTASAKVYWLMVYPQNGPNSGSTYTGAYTITITAQGSLFPAPTSLSGGDFTNAHLNTSISGDAPFLNLGTLSSSDTISYSGTTSASTPTKWTHSQLGTASGRSSGVANDAVPEHLFRFTTSGSADLTISLTGSSSQQVALSVFQSGSVPQTHSTLSPTNVQTSNNATTSASVSGTYSGTYYVLVHGAQNGQQGAYTLTLAPSSTLGVAQTGGSFSTSTLNRGFTTTTKTFSGLNDGGAIATYGDFGTVSASQAYVYSGHLSTSARKRWQPSALATGSSGSSARGCREYSGSGPSTQDSYEHVFRFHLDSALDTTIRLEDTAGSFDAVLGVYGPIDSATFGTETPTAGTGTLDTPQEVFNNGGSLSTRSCVTVVDSDNDSSISGTLAAGDYIVVVHSYRDDNDQTGYYDLSVGPTTGTFPAPYANFGTLSTTPKYFSSTLSSSTLTKWTGAQMAVTGSASGCRSSTTTTAYEHAYKFTLSGSSAIAATLNTSNGGTAFNGIMSIYGPVSSWGPSVPSASTALTTYGSTVQTCVNVNQTTTTFHGGSYPAGDYLLVVHGQSSTSAGDYTLTLALDSGAQAGGNFSNSALNASSGTTTSMSFSGLNNSGTPATFGDFGTVNSTQGYTYSGSLSSSTQKRWTRSQVATSTSLSSYSASYGCRSSWSGYDSNHEHAFRFYLGSQLNTTVSLTTTSLDAAYAVYGPITWTGSTPGVSGANAAATFNGGSALAVSSCNNADGSTSSISGTWDAGYYLVLVYSRRNGSSDTGNYTLAVGPTSYQYTAPYADFGTLSASPKSYAGTLSSSTANKWSSTNVGFGSTPNGCRNNSSSASYEHAFKFSLSATSNVTAWLSTSTGSSAFDGVVSIFGPISSWTSSVPMSGKTLTSYGGSVAACSRANQTSTSLTGTYGAGDYLAIVHGRDTGNAGNYRLSLSATTAPFTANSQDSTLNGTTTAVVADFGDVTSNAYSYSGDTSSAPAKWSNGQLGSSTLASCRSTTSTTSRDAVGEHVFKFSTTQARDMKITLSNPSWGGSGSKDWDSVVSLFGPSSSDPSVALAISNPVSCKQTSTGDSVITQSLSTAGTYYLVVHGDTNSDRGPYTLTVQPNTVTSSRTPITSNSLNSTLDGGANVPVVADFGTLSTTAYSYSGDTTNAVSKWIGSDLATTSAADGSTSAANGCRLSSTSDTGEHVFKFTLGSSKYVSLSLSPTSFDPVLSVFGPLSSPPKVDQTVASTTTMSCFHTSANTGTATNGTASISNTFAAGTYYVVVHGYASTTDNPSAKSAGTYTLTVNPNAPITVTSRSVTTNNAAAEAQVVGSATAIDLGTVNNYITSYSGTTSTSTANKWSAANLTSGSTSGTGATAGCRSSSSQNSGREHMFKFTVSGSSALPLRVALSGTLDGALSIFSGGTAPVSGSSVSTLLACTHVSTPAADATSGSYTASAGEIAGSFPPGTYYAIVHGYAANSVGAYSLAITDNSTTYTSVTAGSNSTVAGSSGPQAGVDLGAVDGRLINYSGNTTNATSKWTQAQVSSAGNTGCRELSNDTAHEHLLKFSVTSARRVALRVSTASGSSYDPVLSVFNTSAPSTNTLVSGLLACSRKSSAAVPDNAVTTGFTASSGLITGTFNAGTYYVLIHGHDDINSEGAYTLSVFDAEPESLGVVDMAERVQIDGDTSNISFNQWQGSDFPADTNGVTEGGRYAGSERTSERLYKFVVSGSAKTLTVSLTASFDSSLSVFDALPTAIPAGGTSLTGHLETNRNSGSYLRSITRSFAPGTYYVMVHGFRANTPSTPSAGTYTLSVGDDNWQSGLIACNSRGASSKLTGVNLSAGSYYLVLKSGAGTGMVDANYRYVLNVRRTFSEPFIACDHEGYGEGTRRSYIETTLEGGKTYAVVVRGVTPSDQGNYGVVIRDMTSGNVPLGCANSAGYTTASNNPESFTADLQAGRTYYVVVRSNSESSVGPSNVRISHSTSAMCAFNNVTFDSVGSSTGVSPYVPSKIVTKLPAGEYYAVVKGNQNLYQSSVKIPTGSTAGIPDDRGRGRYQITFGDATLAQNNQQFSSPAWGTASSGGVYDELTARGIRVITVNSVSQHGSADLYMREQSRVISEATGAVDENGTAIRRNIGPDGSGMGYAIVDAVASFANAVQMDMSVRLSLTPDDPGLVSPFNRRFDFLSRAVPAEVGTNNGCASPIDTDGDGVLDTHPNCGPGATPRFEISVTNPERGNPGDLGECIGGPTPGSACTLSSECGSGRCSPPYPKNVPVNPADPGGGYTMTLQLVGKDRLSTASSPQVIDEIPLYVIPEDVLPDTTTTYPTSATYSQTVNSTGCLADETATWRRLYWTDTLPAGTAIEWRACVGNTDAELAACTAQDFKLIARVTPGAACTTSADCTNAFCNNPTLLPSAGTCESAVGGTCSVASDCGEHAVCVAGACHHTGNPGVNGVDLSGFVKAFNARPRMRVSATLFSNSDRSLAPTIHTYRVDYTCALNE